MLWQFTRSNSMRAKIKWYATAREPSQWKQNQGISMFQLCFNQGRFRGKSHPLYSPFPSWLLSQAKRNIYSPTPSRCAKKQVGALIWHGLRQMQASKLMGVRMDTIQKLHLVFQFQDEKVKKHMHSYKNNQKQSNVCQLCPCDAAWILPRSSQTGWIEFSY